MLRVWGLGFRKLDLGFGVWGLVFMCGLDKPAFSGTHLGKTSSMLYGFRFIGFEGLGVNVQLVTIDVS